MNTTYHLLAPSKEEYDKMLEKMVADQDPALCCANVIWRPSQLTEYYEANGWEGQPLGKIFKNLGIQKASMMFYNLVVNRCIPEKDAWLEVYSKEVAA